MTATETIYTDKKEVSCNGGVLGHPKVYLNIGVGKEIACPYCSKKFLLNKNSGTK